MDAAAPLTDPTPVLLELGDFLREINSPLSAGEALTEAVRGWIRDERQRDSLPEPAASPSPAPPAPTPLRGYQWKCLFLPEGSDLRMTYAHTDYFASVSGGAIVYQGERMSPRQFTQAVAGDGRNAWRDLWVRMPTEKSWTRAQLLRRKLEQRAAARPLSPLDAMQQAATCMSDTLKSALALIDQTSKLLLPKAERRLTLVRRSEDVLADACRLD
jgi:hypothetical protein